MKSRLTTTLLFVPAVIAVVFNTSPLLAIDFQQNLAEARADKEDVRPLVLVFGAEWCRWCRKMAVDTLTDPDVEAIADGYRWVRIDIDKQPELAARYRTQGVPRTIVLDNRGRLLGSRGGYIPPNKFILFLAECLKNPHPEELIPDLIQRFLLSEKEDERQKTTEQLVDQLSKPSRDRRSEILNAFEQKGSIVWSSLLKMMGDDRLSVRAAAAGALKHSTQAELAFHPFAKPEARLKQLAAWQQWDRLS